MNITDDNVARVPLVESDVVPKQHWETLRQKHQELLTFVKDDTPGTEAIAYYSLRMRELAKYKGEQGAGIVFGSRFNIPHIAIHTHPDGETFTLQDITRLIMSDNMLALSAVGNNGVVYWLEKEANADLGGAKALLSIEFLKKSDYLSSPERYIALVEEFLNSLKAYGVNYEKWGWSQ